MLRSAFIVWNEREVLTWRYARPRRWEPRCRRNAGQALMDIERRYRRGVFKDITWWARSVDAERVALCRRVIERVRSVEQGDAVDA